MLPHASHDLLVLSDSDIRVEASYLENVIAALEEPGVGAVSCLYCGVPAGGIWSRLAAEGINSHFLPNALVGLRFGLAQAVLRRHHRPSQRHFGQNRRL